MNWGIQSLLYTALLLFGQTNCNATPILTVELGWTEIVVLPSHDNEATLL